MTTPKDTCRCCLSEGKFKSMKCVPSPSSRQSYAEMLNDILGYPLYHNGEVQLICGTCSIKLCQAVSFRKQVQAAEMTFVACWQQKTSEMKQECLDDDDMMIIPDEKLEIITDDILPNSIDNEDRSLLFEKSEISYQNDSSLTLQRLLQTTDEIHNKTSLTHGADGTKNVVLAEINLSFNKNKVDTKKENILSKKEKILAKSGEIICKKCEVFFSDKSVYKRHILVCNRTCHRCKMYFKGHHNLQRHKVDVHNDGFVCNICDYVYLWKWKLVQHQRQCHMKEKNVKCAHCEFEAFNKASLVKHMRAHYDFRPFQCRTCKKKFKNSSARNFHERIHTGDKRKVCHVCGDKFVQRASLKYHLEKYHPGDAC